MKTSLAGAADGWMLRCMIHHDLHKYFNPVS